LQINIRIFKKLLTQTDRFDLSPDHPNRSPKRQGVLLEWVFGQHARERPGTKYGADY
jgi:hypothetical protein